MENQDDKLSLNEIRKKRLQFRLRQLRKQWKIFYRSTYGKIGFYIILVFAIISLIAPLIEVHHDSLSYVAPAIDTTAPSILASSTASFGGAAMVNGTPITLQASTITGLGSDNVYLLGSNGAVSAMGLGASQALAKGKIANLFNVTVNSTVSPLGISVFTLSKGIDVYSGSQVLSNFVLVSTSNGNITLASISHKSGIPYASSIKSIDLHEKLILPAISSVLPINTPQTPSVPFLNPSEPGATSNIASIYAVVSEPTGYYLYKISDSSMKVDWSTKISTTSAPNNLQFMGSFYGSGSGQRVILSTSNEVFSYYTNGTLAWDNKVPGETFYGSMFIPYGYQLSPNSYNQVFLMGRSSISSGVYGFNTMSGAATTIFNSSSPNSVTAISSSLGIGGFPSAFLVISNNTAYVLSDPQVITGNVSLIKTYGPFVYNPLYDQVSGQFIIAGVKGGIYDLSSSLGSNPFNWAAVYVPGSSGVISNPALIINGLNDKSSIGFVGGNGAAIIYSATGTTTNPMPPTFHTPSGTIFPLGTTTEGSDVWSQFIASFTPDWVIGISVGLIGVTIAIVLGMLIGYYRGFISTALDTITLVIYLIPGLALLIALTSVLSPSFLNIILILSFLSWPFTTFTILGVIRSIKQRTFVDAARVSGAGSSQILRRHMLPNIIPLLIYLTAVNISGAVGGISTLQYLGVAPLTIQTWGAMLNPLQGNFNLAAQAPWWIIPPAIAITLFITAFIFLSRGVDELVNPRIRRR